MNKNFNPDILDCLANLSSDEVFTPPNLVNNLLDLLPQSLFASKDTKFLDPTSKSGSFLREIVKRLIKGLENEIPDLETRVDHILKKQVYGISITNLTHLMTKRTLYTSYNVESKNSIFKLNKDKSINSEGNIFYENINHTWDNGKCIYCGASASQYDRDSKSERHAYMFIHKIPKEIKNMKFDVIIGNPPYQLSTGGAQAQATPLYDKFVLQAKKLQPRYIVMIVPSRWFTGGFGLNDFRNNMLSDNKIRVIHDFLDASECFPGVEIKGGVNYFLWERDNPGKCEVITHENGVITSREKRYLKESGESIFVRYNGAVSVLNKIKQYKEPSLNNSVSMQKPFGLPTNFSDIESVKSKDYSIKIYANKRVGYCKKSEITKSLDIVDKWKVIAPKAIGSGDSKTDFIKTIITEPNSVCTETYIVLGSFNVEEEAKNFVTYVETKFFHFLVTLVKNTQDSLAKVYSYVPVQSYKLIWSDEKLFKKYNLTKDEITFIEKMIWSSEIK
jgi:site-specific DNA-methyltransferase (adenine-specific)